MLELYLSHSLYPEFKHMEETILDDSLQSEHAKPKIYSKTAVRGFGFLFSNFFGGFMLFKNLNAINEKGAAIRALVTSILFTAVIVIVSSLNVANGTNISFILNLAGSFGLSEWYFAKYFPNAKEYPYRKVWVELSIGLAIVAVYFAIVFLLPKME